MYNQISAIKFHFFTIKLSSNMNESAPTFDLMVKDLSSCTVSTLMDGMYNVQGNQLNVAHSLNNPPKQYSSLLINAVRMNPQGAPFMPARTSIKQANIIAVGNQTKPFSSGYYMLTVIVGAFLIFPLFLICCMWWRKIVYPKYEMTINFYRTLEAFLKREKQCTMLNLTVVDNTFNAQKARILYESLQGTSLMGFTFRNLALACNQDENQADQFIANMTPIKSLPFPSLIIWHEMIV